jgi:hypothetical protein
MYPLSSFLIVDITQSDTCKVGDEACRIQVEVQTFISILSLFTLKQMLHDNLYVHVWEILGPAIIPEERDVDFAVPPGITLRWSWRL